MTHCAVMAGLVPAIHVLLLSKAFDSSCPSPDLIRGFVPGIHVLLFLRGKTWMAGTSPAMTRGEVFRHARACRGHPRLALPALLLWAKGVVSLAIKTTCRTSPPIPDSCRE